MMAQTDSGSGAALTINKVNDRTVGVDSQPFHVNPNSMTVTMTASGTSTNYKTVNFRFVPTNSPGTAIDYPTSLQLNDGQPYTYDVSPNPPLAPGQEYQLYAELTSAELKGARPENFSGI